MNTLKRTLKALLPRKLHQALLLVWYSGNRFVCPFCKGHFRQFWPSGVDAKPNTLCPRCSSLERHRLLWLYLQERTNLFTANLKVLHFAPEPMFQKVFKAMPNLDYISADLDSPVADVRMDITNIAFKNDAFDVIFCVHVLEHIPDDQQAMRELYRVLKPGGWAILQSPLDLRRNTTFEDPSIVSSEERERFFNQSDHVRIYGRDYEDRLKRAGFAVKVDGYVRELGDKAKRYGLDVEEDIYLCTRPQ